MDDLGQITIFISYGFLLVNIPPAQEGQQSIRKDQICPLKPADFSRAPYLKINVLVGPLLSFLI